MNHLFLLFGDELCIATNMSLKVLKVGFCIPRGPRVVPSGMRPGLSPGLMPRGLVMETHVLIWKLTGLRGHCDQL